MSRTATLSSVTVLQIALQINCVDVDAGQHLIDTKCRAASYVFCNYLIWRCGSATYTIACSLYKGCSEERSWPNCHLSTSPTDAAWPAELLKRLVSFCVLISSFFLQESLPDAVKVFGVNNSQFLFNNTFQKGLIH